MGILNGKIWKKHPLALPDERESPESVAVQHTTIGSPSSIKSARELNDIAQASVKLAALGPCLARMAAEMETEAQNQARRATEITRVLEGFTSDLESAVKELRTSSSQVEKALDTVSHLAEHTRIISINAGIEAVRAGEHGKAFGVVVDEVQKLADRTGETTRTIEDRISSMRQSILQVAMVAGNNDNVTGSETNTVETVNRQVHGMVESANEQLGEAKTLHHLGDQMNGFTGNLLLALGTFRFEAHHQAEQEVSQIVPLFEDIVGKRQPCENVLEDWMARHSSFELAYITDAKGRQFVDNIARKNDKVVHDAAGYGKDWSKRPWYLDAIRHEGLHSTDIYRSTATGDFCFTVTMVLRDTGGEILGVLGADVNFQRLLQR